MTDLETDLQKAETKLRELQGSHHQPSPQESQSQSTNTSDEEVDIEPILSDSPQLAATEMLQQGETTASDKETQQHQILVTYLKVGHDKWLTDTSIDMPFSATCPLATAVGKYASKCVVVEDLLILTKWLIDELPNELWVETLIDLLIN